jgi:2-polyprenyl-6-methoxyphenol hydroxylase-like FAD-dependent oxidoreductase
VLDRIDGDGSLLVNAVQRVDCDTFVDGRLVLVGDAAHAMEPTLGQGANSAFVDAAVLAGVLSPEADLGDALIAYDRRRRPAVQAVQRAADRAARLTALHSSMAAGVRNRFVRLASAPKFVGKRYRALQQEDPAELYRAVSALAGRASVSQRPG